MDDKEYVKNTCSKCLNKYNDKDLCNIVKTIDGKFKCCNEDLGQPGEFIRTEKGYIFPIDKNKDLLKLAFFLDASIGKIKKHNRDLLDLIEQGDVLEIEEDGDIFYIGIKKDITTFSYSDIKESIRKKEVKLLRILTHEQFEENSFDGGYYYD